VRALILILALGCGSLDLDAALVRGQARWTQACGRTPAPDYVTWGPREMRCGPLNNAWGCHESRAGVTIIRISRAVPTQAMLDQVVTHELGHELGAGHVPPHRGIMAGGLTYARPNITAWDIAEANCPHSRPEAPDAE
jgi:hypothetical protein